MNAYITDNRKKIVLNGKEVSFGRETIRKIVEVKNLIIVIFEWTTIPPDYWPNVVAIDSNSGDIIWEVGKHPKGDRDYKNPYSHAADAGSYIILHKSDGWKVPVNYRTGKVLESIDLNSGGRPW